MGAASPPLLPVQDSGIDIGDITARKALRKQLQCKTFRWYLVSVYPEMRMYSDIIAYGVVRNMVFGFHSGADRQKTRLERGSKREEKRGNKATVTSTVSYDKLGLSSGGQTFKRL